MIMKFTKTLKINKVMKRVLLLFTFAAFVFAQKTASAQEKNNHKDRWEKYKSEKVAFITTKLDLTPQEAEKFWPVYNALEKERSDAQREKRLLEKQVYEASETLSDKEAVDLTRNLWATRKRNASWTPTTTKSFWRFYHRKKCWFCTKPKANSECICSVNSEKNQITNKSIKKKTGS